MPKTATPPLTKRPLDLLYYIYFVMHLFATLLVDILPLWPTVLTTLPFFKQVHGFGKYITTYYTNETNDPFMLATWGLVQRDWEFKFMVVFMWMEVFIQLPATILGIIGLQRGSVWIYPIMLSYASAALVSTITVAVTTISMPASYEKNLDPVSQFYSLSDEGRRTILGPIIPFLIVPAIMWVDTLVKTLRLVIAGANATKKDVRKKTN